MSHMHTHTKEIGDHFRKCRVQSDSVHSTVHSKVTFLLLSLKLSAQLVPGPCNAAFAPFESKTSWSSLFFCYSPACHCLPEKETRHGSIVFPLL